MFKISTRGDYGLLLLAALAEQHQQDKKYVSLKDIAELKKLSLPYLSQIISPLKKAGFVKSKEGRDGGYCLAKPARKITIMEILETLEGPIMPVQCCNKKIKCCRESRCGLKSTWNSATALLIKFLRAKTLEDALRH